MAPHAIRQQHRHAAQSLDLRVCVDLAQAVLAFDAVHAVGRAELAGQSEGLESVVFGAVQLARRLRASKPSQGAMIELSLMEFGGGQGEGEQQHAANHQQ